MPDIRQVSFHTVLDLVDMTEYEQECALPELGPTQPNRAIYAALELSGALQVFAAYMGQEIVGFATVMIYEVPHYSKKVATTESIFVSREYRKYGVGVMLIRFVKDFARQKGCVKYLCSAPVDSQFDMLMKASKGSRHSNNVYVVDL